VEVTLDNSARKPVWPHFEGRIGKLREMRFWSKVDMRGPDECWDWQASRHTSGYGRFKITPGTMAVANRIAWALTHKRDPGEMLVRHTCDRPQCCNPAHLELGTHADNMADKSARGRWRGGDHSGVKNPRALLSEDQVSEIVRRLNLGQNNSEIARHVPVGHSLVSRIRLGLSWRRETAALGWVPKPQFRRPKPSNDESEIARLGGVA
jgi:hypothetical protein